MTGLGRGGEVSLNRNLASIWDARKLQNETVVTATQHGDCASCTAPLKIVTVLSSMLCIFYHNIKKLETFL